MKNPIFPLFLLCNIVIASIAQAAGDDDLYENQCHDHAAWDTIDVLLKQFPNDAIVIRTYALRLGICQLIAGKKISLETGARMFTLERQRAVMERSMEEARRKRKKSESAEYLEPVS